jgi:hypothetical protein
MKIKAVSLVSLLLIVALLVTTGCITKIENIPAPEPVVKQGEEDTALDPEQPSVRESDAIQIETTPEEQANKTPKLASTYSPLEAQEAIGNTTKEPVEPVEAPPEQERELVEENASKKNKGWQFHTDQGQGEVLEVREKITFVDDRRATRSGEYRLRLAEVSNKYANYIVYTQEKVDLKTRVTVWLNQQDDVINFTIH